MQQKLNICMNPKKSGNNKYHNKNLTLLSDSGYGTREEILCKIKLQKCRVDEARNRERKRIASF